MKLTESKLRQIIRREIINEAAKFGTNGRLGLIIYSKGVKHPTIKGTLTIKRSTGALTTADVAKLSEKTIPRYIKEISKLLFKAFGPGTFDTATYIFMDYENGSITFEQEFTHTGKSKKQYDGDYKEFTEPLKQELDRFGYSLELDIR